MPINGVLKVYTLYGYYLYMYYLLYLLLYYYLPRRRGVRRDVGVGC